MGVPCLPAGRHAAKKAIKNIRMKPFLLYLFVLLTNVLLAQNRYDVVIDEIMTDPSPQIGLPGNEWIEEAGRQLKP